MMYFAYNEKNEEFFKKIYDDEILRQMFKYITSIVLIEDEISAFVEQLKAYENVGLSFYFYYMDSLEKEDERRICGFSNFALTETEEGSFIDISHIGDEDMHKYFNKIFQDDGYFIVSDNFLRKESYEEQVFKKIPERKERTWNPIIIK